jgi:hypothetical protein
MTRIKSMMINRRLPRLLALWVGIGVLIFGSNRAQAIFDMGFGWGMGLMHQVPSPTGFLNQHALIAAGRGPQGPSRTPYAGNPNAYFNRIRDNGFVPHYDVRRRRAPTYRAESMASLGNTNRVEPQPAAATNPVVPLGHFFDAGKRFVWPGDSPSNGDLSAKRDASDQAMLAVLEETKQQTTASIASVVDARQKLLDYGRPALQEIRAQATPPVADGFHRFLLSVYDSLELAATPEETSSGTPANP